MFSPCIIFLEKGIARGNLIVCPVENLNFFNFIKTLLATEKGHLDQEQKYLKSTKDIDDSILNDNFPAPITESANNIFAKIFNPLHETLNLKSKAYIDLMGRLPHKSSRGNSYIF